MALTRRSISPSPLAGNSLAGRRVLITGAARGIGAALAQRLHERGALVAVAGLEPDLLEAVAAPLGAPWWNLDVTDRVAVDDVVDAAADRFRGLDVVVANAGVAAQLPIVGGDPSLMIRTHEVNVLGTYFTLRAAGRHIRHDRGYAVAVSSLAAAVHVPLLGAYSSSKAAVEAIGNTMRQEVRPSGARVGVAYFAELDTDMTSRGFGTEAAQAFLKGKSLTKVSPMHLGIDALERGIERRSRRIIAPRYVGPILPIRAVAQHVVELASRRRIATVMEIAEREVVDLTTPQPAPPTPSTDERSATER